ncbi:hypothetical protein [Actinoplanes solisilvae]|uniref:hypothetical protein n=1 Tax=Actinoplanes solisilvae TaxID=2486853 RepID=UPI000FDA48D5|nr:hypothetical protein [Actinoplanes solisilvae]
MSVQAEAAPSAEDAPPVSTDEKPQRAKPEQGTLQPGTGAGETAEADKPADAELIKTEAVTNAGRTDAERRALESALITFGLPTNQQINILGRQDAVAAQDRRPQSAHTLARVRASFVFPEDYTAARERLLDSHLLFLSGRAGSGREHLALHLLDALCDGQVDHLVGGRVDDCDPESLVQDAGYLWTGLGTSIELSRIEQLVEALRTTDAKMIVVWPHRGDLPFQLEDHRLTIDNPPDQREILNRHLRGDDDADHPDVAKLFAEPEVLRAVAQLGGVGDAAALGRALRDFLAGRCALPDALSKAASETASWFVQLPEREDKAFALALSALDGMSMPVVVAAARRMDEIIQETEDPEHRSSIRTWARPTRRLLAAVDAECRRGEVVKSYGKIPATVVASNRNEYPRSMLSTLWHEFPYFQQVYLDWVEELVRGPDPDVRERAAIATSLLAVDDFEFIRSRVLDGWADGKQREVRRASATALRVPATNESLREVVWGLLENWATVKEDDRRDRSRLQLTAAVALGGPVGATDCDRALDIITRRFLEYKPGRYPLWGAVVVAVVELFGDGSSQQSGTVLDRLVAWAVDDRTGPREVAVGAMLAIASQPSTAGPADGTRSVPLLRAVATNPDNLEAAALLLRLAINDGIKIISEEAVAVLSRIADNVRGEDEAVLERLVEAIPRTARDVRTLRYEFRLRAREDSHLPIFDRLIALLRRQA